MHLNLNKLSPLSFMTLVMVFFVTVSPGVLFLFIYTRDVFFEIDSFKLILLSFGISSPFWIINTFPYFFWEGVGSTNKPNNALIACLAGSLWSIPVVYFPIIASFFWKASFETIAIMMFVLEVMTLIIIFVKEMRRK
jgi:hypothetical protein